MMLLRDGDFAKTVDAEKVIFADTDRVAAGDNNSFQNVTMDLIKQCFAEVPTQRPQMSKVMGAIQRFKLAEYCRSDTLKEGDGEYDAIALIEREDFKIDYQDKFLSTHLHYLVQYGT